MPELLGESGAFFWHGLRPSTEGGRTGRAGVRGGVVGSGRTRLSPKFSAAFAILPSDLCMGGT